MSCYFFLSVFQWNHIPNSWQNLGPVPNLRAFCTCQIAVLTPHLVPPIRPDYFRFRTLNFESVITPLLVPPKRRYYFRFCTRLFESGLTRQIVWYYSAPFRNRPNPTIAVPITPIIQSPTLCMNTCDSLLNTSCALNHSTNPLYRVAQKECNNFDH